MKMPPASLSAVAGWPNGRVLVSGGLQEQGAGLSRRPDAELGLRAVDVVLNGAERDIEDDRDVGKGLALFGQREVLTFAVGQVDAGEDMQRLQLFAHPPVEPVGDDVQRKRVSLGGVQEGYVLLISGEGERGEPAVPVMDRNCVAVTDAEARAS